MHMVWNIVCAHGVEHCVCTWCGTLCVHMVWNIVCAHGVEHCVCTWCGTLCVHMVCIRGLSPTVSTLRGIIIESVDSINRDE